MEDLVVFENFNVLSNSGEYSVFFIEDSISIIKDLGSEKSIFIVDLELKIKTPKLELVLEDFSVIYVESTEKSKSYYSIGQIIDKLISLEITRSHKIVAIGGGVIQDISGFVSSILFRGIEWFYLPSTLLSQADSCIGSKTSINFETFKNQLGNFYPPKAIYIDFNFLNTLPRAEIQSGIGEMFHYFFLNGIDDVSDFGEVVLSNKITNFEIYRMISKSLSIKKRFIENDEFDSGARLLLNFGHSFGHAIESLSSYQIPHGICVAIGMDIACFISLKLNMMKKSDYYYSQKILRHIYKDYTFDFLEAETIVKIMRKDKKNKDGKFGLILTHGWGKMELLFIEPNAIFIDYIDQFLKGLEQ